MADKLPTSQRDGVIFMAAIGSLSTLSLILLIGHIFSVSFWPYCLSTFNIRKTSSMPYSSSTGNSTSQEIASIGRDRKSSVAGARVGAGSELDYSVDLDRSKALDERKARARAREISRQTHRNNEERVFLRMQLGVFIICMLLSDLIQSCGVLIQARWAYLGKVEPGVACSVQGAMITFGDVATAVWNAVIACHTFATVVLGVRMSTIAVAVVVVLGWTIPILMNVIGSVVIATPKANYYDVAGAWCFISNAYYIERVVLHYVPLLFAALIITIMYSLVSLTMRGNLQVTVVSTRFGIPRLSVSWRRTTMNRASTTGNTNQKQVAYLRSLSMKMLWYPCVYICLVLPISICRMVELQKKKAPFPLLFFAMTLLFLVGLSNVAIYVTTRNVGVPRKNTTGIRSMTNPNNGTQMEIYIDRVTQHEVVGTTTIGGTALHGRDRSGVHFEDVKMDDMRGGLAKIEDDHSSQNSWERDIADAKSPNSASHFISNSPTYIVQNSPPEAYFPRTQNSPPEMFLPRSTDQNYTISRSNSVGNVVVDRFGVMPTHEGYDAPFHGSVAEMTPSTISPFTRSLSPGPNHPYVIPTNNERSPYVIPTDNERRLQYAWEHHKKSMRSIG